MDYVYKGEVEVSKEQLNELINAGKVLQIKGLQEMVILTYSSRYILKRKLIIWSLRWDRLGNY